MTSLGEDARRDEGFRRGRAEEAEPDGDRQHAAPAPRASLFLEHKDRQESRRRKEYDGKGAECPTERLRVIGPQVIRGHTTSSLP